MQIIIDTFLDKILDWGMDKLMGWCMDFLLDFLSGFPTSPLVYLEETLQLREYMEIVNYFIPMNFCCTVIGSCCSAIFAIYGFKFIKGTLSIKDNLLGKVIGFLM